MKKRVRLYLVCAIIFMAYLRLTAEISQISSELPNLANTEEYRDWEWDTQIGSPGINGPVHIIAQSSRNIYIGGNFSSANGAMVGNLVKYRKSTGQWTSLGTGVNGSVYAIAIDFKRKEIYLGGSFTKAGNISVTNIAKYDAYQYDNSGWLAVGSGVQGKVNSIVVDGDNIYVGGSFYMAGGITVNHVARWDGTSWHDMDGGASFGYYAEGGEYIQPRINELFLHNGFLYAAGDFSIIGDQDLSGGGNRGVARWDGSQWSFICQNTGYYDNGPEYITLGSCQNKLYLGGKFYVGDTETKNIAWLNGNQWEGWFGLIPYHVFGIGSNSSTLFTGGWGPMEGISVNALYNNQWYSIDNGMQGDLVNTLCADSQYVFLGGQFTKAGGVASYNIACWKRGEPPTENRSPIAVNDTASVPQDSMITLSVLNNDTDPDGDVLAIIEVGDAGSAGSAMINPGDMTLTFMSNF